MFKLFIVDEENIIWYWANYCLNHEQSKIKYPFNMFNVTRGQLFSYIKKACTYPQIIIINVNKDSLEFIHDILKYPDTYVIAIIDKSLPLTSYLYRLYNLNVHGLLDRSGSYPLDEVLNNVLQGHGYIQPNLSHLLINYIISGQNDLDYILSNREYEVMQMTYKGMSSQYISERLGVSRRTITKDRKNILNKLNITNFSDLKTRTFSNMWHDPLRTTNNELKT